MRTSPPGSEYAFMEAADGARLRVACWPGAEGKPTIILLPGFREYIEKHFETIEDLQKRGMAVYTMDWRSQGLSDRPLNNPQKVHVDDFDQYIADLHQFISTIVIPDTQGERYILAHSMGGHIALRYLHDHQFDVEGAVLSAPMVEIYTPTGFRWLARLLVKTLKAMGLSKAYFPGRRDYGPKSSRFDGNKLTSDEARFAEDHDQQTANKTLRTGGPSVGWVAAAIRSSRRLKDERYLKAISVPVYIVQCMEDRMVSNRAQDLLSSRINRSQLFHINGAKHEILRERDELRDQFWEIFDHYFELRS